MTKYLMCMYQVHIAYLYQIEVSVFKLVAKRLYKDADADDTNDNYVRWTNHDCIGSFGIKPNEPKIRKCALKCSIVPNTEMQIIGSMNSFNKIFRITVTLQKSVLNINFAVKDPECRIAAFTLFS